MCLLKEPSVRDSRISAGTKFQARPTVTAGPKSEQTEGQAGIITSYRLRTIFKFTSPTNIQITNPHSNY